MCTDEIEVKCVKTCKGWFINNCYYVKNKLNNHAVFIDPSWEIEKFRAIYEEEQCILDGIFLTHHHYDHINLAGELAYLCNCLVFTSNKVEVSSDIIGEDVFMFDAPITINTPTAAVHCIDTPGHTMDSVCYRIGNNYFTGDTVFNEGCGFPDKDEYIPALFQSVQKLKKEVPQECFIFPGHSYGKDVGMAMEEVWKENIYFYLNEIDEFSHYLLRNKSKSNSKFT